MSAVLVVDGANVVGARPDGWWKDRAGAARRLHEALIVADLPHDQVILVLEGAAKAGVPAGSDGHLRVVHAAKDGDAEIVRQAHAAADAGHQVQIVTADRLLSVRVARAGETLGPRWLLDRI